LAAALDMRVVKSGCSRDARKARGRLPPPVSAHQDIILRDALGPAVGRRGRRNDQPRVPMDDVDLEILRVLDCNYAEIPSGSP
jgi:hypothetical protein